MEIPLHIGLDKVHPDSLLLVWPDNTFQKVRITPGDSALTLSWQKGLPPFNYALLTDRWKNPARPMKTLPQLQDCYIT